MKTTELTIVNPTGIHARPASAVCNKAGHYKSKITFINKRTGRTANAKSIMNLLALGLCKGATVIINAEGEDEQEAIDGLTALISSLSE